LVALEDVVVNKSVALVAILLVVVVVVVLRVVDPVEVVGLMSSVVV